jgi:hypothetical protein
MTADASCRLSLAATTFVAVLVFGPAEMLADPVTRIDHVPGGGFVGDTWTFTCPRGGSFSLAVNTFPDVPVDGGFASALDPIVEVYDGRGNLLAVGDDETECTAESLCGAACPVAAATCGRGRNHSVVVSDAGALEGCEIGGSYVLAVEILNRSGRSLGENRVKLGGGPASQVPRFILDQGLAGVQGPAIDDGFRPLLPEVTAANQTAGASDLDAIYDSVRNSKQRAQE